MGKKKREPRRKTIEYTTGKKAQSKLVRRGFMGAKLFFSLVVTVVFYLIYSSNYLSDTNLSLQDAIFQSEKSISEEIVVIGATAQDLVEYGMWPWDRLIWADVLQTINSDPETQPAAIGVSISFNGWSQPLSDKALTDEITKDNVVLACSGDIGWEMVPNGRRSQERILYITDISYPFLHPHSDVQLGHINVMLDADGVLRRSLLQITTEQGGTINSMAYEVLKMYNDFWGIETEIIHNLDENGFWYVDYTASSGEYFDYSVKDILTGNYDQEDLAGKMVLIGVYDKTLLDYYIPAIDHSESIYIVEFIANCINAMLNDTVITEIHADTEIALMLVITFVVTFMALNLRFGVMSLLTIFIAAIGLVCISVSYYNGTLISPLYLLISLFAAYILAIIFNYWLEWYSRRHITTVFSQYVDPKVMEDLIESDWDGLHAMGVNYKIAVLFVDLRGFSGVSEHMEGQTVVNILNEFLAMTETCIRKYDGTLDKFIGDCTMAFWGAPHPIEDPIYSACASAVEMMEQSAELIARIKAIYDVELTFGIGIHYGNAIVGNVGSPTRLDYTAIGNTVNMASRLENSAPQSTIYVSKVVADHMGDRAVLEKLEKPVVFKGLSESMEVYVLKSVKKPTGGEGAPG